MIRVAWRVQRTNRCGTVLSAGAWTTWSEAHRMRAAWAAAGFRNLEVVRPALPHEVRS